MGRGKRKRLVRHVDRAQTFSPFFVVADVDQLNIGRIAVRLDRTSQAHRNGDIFGRWSLSRRRGSFYRPPWRLVIGVWRSGPDAALAIDEQLPEIPATRLRLGHFSCPYRARAFLPAGDLPAAA